MIKPEDVGAFVQDRQNHEGELRFVVFDEGAGDAHDDEERVADRIFPAERAHVGGAFQRGVPEVDDEAETKYTEEPLAARHEILFETGIFRHVIRKKQAAQEKDVYGVANKHGVDFEHPLMHVNQPKLPPPEVNEMQQDGENPQDVRREDFHLFRMLHETRESIEQARDR